MDARAHSRRPIERSTRLTGLVAWFALAVGAALVVLVSWARNADVVARGALLPFYPGYEVEQVRIIGLDLYVDLSISAPDRLTAVLLALMGVLALVAAAHLARVVGLEAGMAPRATLLGGFALVLAADEVLAVHETLGHNLPGLLALPSLMRPDVVVVGIYGLVALAAAWHARRLLTVSRPAVRLVALAVVAAGCAVVLDLFSGRRQAEERLEVTAALLLVLAAAALASGARRSRLMGHQGNAKPAVRPAA